MKKSQATFKIILALAAALTLAGCKKHKPPLPPQSQPPAVIEQPPPPQPVTPEPAVTPPEEEPAANPKPPVPTPKPPPVRHTRAPKRQTNGGDKPGPEIAKAAPPKIVIQETPVSPNPTAAAPLTAHDEAAHNAASTAQLNESTEANLSGIKRRLSPQEQATESQIRDYLNQSAQAGKDGDILRARNLALKAHLLSDDLAKPR